MLNPYTSAIIEAEGDSKQLWKVLKDVTKTTKQKETIEPENMTQEKANSFNKFFATIGTKIKEKLKIKPHSNNFTGLKGLKIPP